MFALRVPPTHTFCKQTSFVNSPQGGGEQLKLHSRGHFTTSVQAMKKKEQRKGKGNCEEEIQQQCTIIVMKQKRGNFP